jgi:hypothetical protein
MPTSPQSLYLARALRAAAMWIESRPSIALSLGSDIDIVGFANSEKHLHVIARECDAETMELEGSPDLYTGKDLPGVRFRFYHHGT